MRYNSIAELWSPYDFTIASDQRNCRKENIHHLRSGSPTIEKNVFSYHRKRSPNVLPSLIRDPVRDPMALSVTRNVNTPIWKTCMPNHYRFLSKNCPRRRLKQTTRNRRGSRVQVHK